LTDLINAIHLTVQRAT
jgi:hypothetical protein